MTTRPFTLVICTACDHAVLDELRHCVRCCPHGMLVSAAEGADTPGAVVVLQPCTHERVATESARWIGPITTRADAMRVRAWVQAGDWDVTLLPTRLRARRPQAPGRPRYSQG